MVWKSYQVKIPKSFAALEIPDDDDDDDDDGLEKYQR
jgi:hypothetical protein